MKKIAILAALLAMLNFTEAAACTNFIITKGASTDGSVMVSYSADSHQLYGALYKYNAPTDLYAEGTIIPIYEWDSGRFLGNIRQAARTYSTVGNMNEHQLIIAETTYGGRPELEDPDGIMDYGSLIYITLQRATTAREAIDIIVDLANEYGYPSGGESFSIADPNEAWIMELIGKGSKIVDGENANKGIVWVARRIPDGYVSAHANQARITQFPLNDPENCIYAPDVVSFAREMGYYEGSDEDFSFCDAYAPLTFSAMRACEARVWSFFNAVADDMGQYVDYAMGHNKNNRMPLWVKPAQKISPKQVFDAMRDHYEGTPMDMTVDFGAGGEACPYRWRPMSFEVDGVEYVNERATATQQTGFWFVAQARSWLPDAVGGILWFGVDDAATSSLTPIYCSTTEVPECFREGNGHMTEYSPTAAFWIYNRVAQFAYLRYNVIGTHVRQEVDKWENARLAEIPSIDAHALSLLKVNPEQVVGVAQHDGKNIEMYKVEMAPAVAFLTDYSVNTAQNMFDTWVELDRYLLVKYIDGNIKREDANGFIDNGHGKNIPVMPEMPGYSDAWKRAVAADHGETLKVYND